MDRSRFLAGLIGPVLTAVAISIFINGDMVGQMAQQISSDYGLIFVMGIVTLTAGLAIVLSHNVWKGWPTVITVFGWLAVVGGALRILAPRHVAEIAPSLVAQGWPVMVMAGLVLVIGLVLSLKAFRA
jgi:hypothetical protein